MVKHGKARGIKAREVVKHIIGSTAANGPAAKIYGAKIAGDEINEWVVSDPEILGNARVQRRSGSIAGVI